MVGKGVGNVRHAGVAISQTIISKLKGEKRIPDEPDGATVTVSTGELPGADARGLRQRVSATAHSTAVIGSGGALPREGAASRVSLPIFQPVPASPSGSRPLAKSAGTLQRGGSATAEEAPSVRRAEAADLAQLIDGEWSGSRKVTPHGQAPSSLPRVSASGVVGGGSGAGDSRRPSQEGGSNTSLPVLESPNAGDVEEGGRSSDPARPSLKPRHGRNLSKVEEGDLELGVLQGGRGAAAKQPAPVAAGQQPQGEVVSIEDIKLEPEEASICKEAHEPWDAGKGVWEEGYCS